jgi:uncharacterized protein with NRDE domain
LNPGKIYGLSNSTQHNDWDKVIRGIPLFEKIIYKESDPEALIEKLLSTDLLENDKWSNYKFSKQMS